MQEEGDTSLDNDQLKLIADSHSYQNITNCIFSSKRHIERQASHKSLKRSIDNVSNASVAMQHLPKFSKHNRNCKGNSSFTNHKSHRTALFSNKENLISQMINERIAMNSNSTNIGSCDLVSFNEVFPISATIDSTNFVLSNYFFNKPPQLKHSDSRIVSMNQTFVDQLNSEIEKFQSKAQSRYNDQFRPCFRTGIRGRTTSATAKAFHKTGANNNGAGPDLVSLSKGFLTNPFLSFVRWKGEDRRNKAMIKQKIIAARKRIPYIIKCMDKRNNGNEGPNSIYFKENFDKDYEERYQKNFVNVEDVLMSHNAVDRKSYGAYAIPKLFLKTKIKPKKQLRDNTNTTNQIQRSKSISYQVQYLNENECKKKPNDRKSMPHIERTKPMGKSVH